MAGVCKRCSQKLKPEDFLEDACKAEKSTAFIPKRKVELPLAELKEKLIEKGASIYAETPFVLMFRFHGANVSLFKSCKILIKEVERTEARQIMEKLLCIIM